MVGWELLMHTLLNGRIAISVVFGKQLGKTRLKSVASYDIVKLHYEVFTPEYI